MYLQPSNKDAHTREVEVQQLPFCLSIHVRSASGATDTGNLALCLANSLAGTMPPFQFEDRNKRSGNFVQPSVVWKAFAYCQAKQCIIIQTLVVLRRKSFLLSSLHHRVEYKHDVHIQSVPKVGVEIPRVNRSRNFAGERPSLFTFTMRASIHTNRYRISA